MKTLLFALAALILAPALRADNLLQNGDFSQGKDHWRGNGLTPDEYAKDNLGAKDNPLTSKGLIIPLHEHSWTKLEQIFKGGKSNYTINFSFMTSPDLKASDKPDDYNDVNHAARLDIMESYLPMQIKTGFIIFSICDREDAKVADETLELKATGSNVQNYSHRYMQPLTPGVEKVLGIGFPPGKGFIVLLSVSVTSD